VTTSPIDAKLLAKMFFSGAANLEANKEWINELNVFPVPDGDTGTNMTLTIKSAVKEVAALGENAGMKDICKAMSSGSLRGARGNSGVILSQFIRGLAVGSENLEYFTVESFAKAFKSGCDYAYHAVATPTEGTMLTVIREASEYLEAVKMKDFVDCFERLLTVMHRSLKNTPKLLAVLREAGVVDSGGAGVVCIFEGMQSVLNGNPVEDIDIPVETSASDIAFDENSDGVDIELETDTGMDESNDDVTVQ
jgi:dihydroxyacetone kinase-like predicted kinase